MQVAIITGGTRGLGLAAARALGTAGWQLLLTYRSDEANASVAVESLRAAGCVVESLRLDAAAPSAAEELSAHPWLAAATRLVVVHNAAASFVPTPVHLIGWETFEAQLAVGLRGLISLAQAVVPRMARTGGGVIAAVLTRAVVGPPPKGFAPYLAAKQAMRSLIKSLAIEHRARGIRAIGLCPGYMDSALTELWNPALRRAAENAGASVVEAAGSEIARLVQAAGTAAVPGDGEEYPL